jgi:hypothetical protein
MDKETETLWFPEAADDCCQLVGVSGYYADWTLPVKAPMEKTTWAQWLQTHPDTGFVLE